MIVTWRSDVDRTLRAFGVGSTVSAWLSLTPHPETELATNGYVLLLIPTVAHEHPHNRFQHLERCGEHPHHGIHSSQRVEGREYTDGQNFGWVGLVLVCHGITTDYCPGSILPPLVDLLAL